MNTPPTIKRGARSSQLFGQLSRQENEQQHKQRRLQLGILDIDIAQSLGFLISAFVYTEDAMTKVLRSLLGTQHLEIAEEIFHALVAQNTRLPVMKALLENTYFNAQRDETYDDLLVEFNEINKLRNKFAHSYWYQDVDTRISYLSPTRKSSTYLVVSEEKVTANDINRVTERCKALMARIDNHPDLIPPYRTDEHSPYASFPKKP